MQVDDLLTVESLDCHRVLTHQRVLFMAKLMLFGILLPLLLTLAYELLVFLDVITSGKEFDTRQTPLLALPLKALGLLMIGAVACGIAAFFLPFLAPLLLFPWSLLCTTAGLLLEIALIVPRMFLGYLLDLLVFRNVENGPLMLYSPAATLKLLALLLAISAVSCFFWFTWYREQFVHVKLDFF